MDENELRSALQERSLVLFIGNDLSREITGVPSRAELAAELAQKYGYDPALRLSDILQRRADGGNLYEPVSLILKAYERNDYREFHHRVAELVKEQGIPVVITTAYDRMLARAFEEQKIAFNHVIDNNDFSFTRPNRPTLIQLYGSAERINSLVITADDHFRLLRDPDRSDVIAEVRQIFRRNTVLFVGYDLSDPDFQFLFNELLDRKFARRAYAIWPGLADDAIKVWRDRNLIILPSVSSLRVEAPQAQAALSKNMELPYDTAMPPDDPQIRLETLRIDAAAPESVVVNQPFALAVAIRQPTSPVLREQDLTVVHSGEAQVYVSDADRSVRLRLGIRAPGCDIDGDDSRSFKLATGKDSPTFYFSLTPRQAGPVTIIIELYQEDDWLGSARVSTEAEMGAPAGQVAVTVVSAPATAKNDRISALEAQHRDKSDLLAIIAGQLAMFTPGSEPPERLLQKQRLEQEIKAIEDQIDALHAQENGP